MVNFRELIGVSDSQTKCDEPGRHNNEAAPAGKGSSEVKRARLWPAILMVCLLLSACAAPMLSDISPQDASVSSGGTSAVPATVSGPPSDASEAISGILGSVITDGETPPSEAQREEIAERLGALGFSVLRENDMMLNYEIMEEFCENASEGRDGEAVVFLYPGSSATSLRFAREKNKITCAYTTYNADGTISGGEPLPVDEFRYTKRGNLIYHIAGNSDKSGFRVAPLSEESRAYYRKYVEPVSTFTQGPLDGSWSSLDFSVINWEWLFERLWESTTGETMLDPASSYYVSDSSRMDGVRLPADVAEGLLMQYFDVSAETLRELEAYEPETSSYFFTGFRGGGYSSTLEVSDWVENPDGSLTLWIDFVSLEFGEELSAQSRLTVMPGQDGEFKYISNEFLSKDAPGYEYSANADGIEAAAAAIGDYVAQSHMGWWNDTYGVSDSQRVTEARLVEALPAGRFDAAEGSGTVWLYETELALKAKNPKRIQLESVTCRLDDDGWVRDTGYFMLIYEERNTPGVYHLLGLMLFDELAAADAGPKEAVIADWLRENMPFIELPGEYAQ